MRFLLITFMTVLLVGSGNGQAVTGTWSGPFKSNDPSGTVEFTFISASKGDVLLKFGGREARGAARDLKISGADLSFGSDVADSDAHFTAKVGAERMLGTFEVYEKGKLTVVGAFCAAKSGTQPCAQGDIPPLPAAKTATQRADDTFDTSVAHPAYPANGPEVLFDEAHKNFHKTTTNFKPFADLMRHDGYRIVVNSEPFTAAGLKGYKVLVISNARGEGDGSAFNDAEIDAVVEWVRNGGSLFLIADHTPFGGYSEKLANRFGVDMSKGYTDDPQNRDPAIKDLLFSRENKLLADHPITRGRNASERVNRVVSFTGQSLKAATGTQILKLGDTAYDEFPKSDRKVPAAGRAQAIAMRFGKGKIFVAGEAAMFTAQFTAENVKFGMNVPGIDNRQFALNVMHWLSGLLK